MASAAPSAVYSIVQQKPSPSTYYELRKVAGLTPPPVEDIPSALAGSWVSFIVVEGSVEEHSDADLASKAIGMGRMVGDGALFLDVVDIAVHPAHQKRGLGKKIMQALLDYADKHAPNAYVSLIADVPGGFALYSKFGFSDVAPSVGMYRCERVRLRKEAARRALAEGHERS